MMTRPDNQLPAAGSRRPAQRQWLFPLLCLLVPALAAVALWAWQRGRAPQRSPHRSLPPLALTGDARRDRLAILERAADLLLPPGSTSAPAEVYLPSGAPLLGEIGIELLPLDPARGTEAVRRSTETESGPGLHEASGLTAPEWTHVGMLVRLARSLRQYPDLAERALQTAYGEAQRHQVAVERVYLLCVFAREAAGIDPVRARSAVQQASSTAAFLPIGAPADAVAAAAAAVAQVEGAAAARPLIDRALQSIPSGAARPLVEARLAARLVNAAPARARALARQALADVGAQAFRRSGVQAFRRSGVGNRPPEHPDARPGTRAAGGARLNARTPAHPKYFGVSLPELRRAEHPKPRTPEHPKPRTPVVSLAPRQYGALAVDLAVSHPDVALAAAQRIPAPAERAAALIEMAVACDMRAPARAGALFRRALRAAEALPAGQGRQSAILDAATGLAAYDLKAARDAVLKAAAAGPVPATSMMMLGARAAKREPAAARKLIEQRRDANPAGLSSFIGSLEIVLAEVTTEPDLRRALVLAQQALGPVLQAQALLAVARRLKQRGEAPAAGARIREQQTTKDTGTQRT